MLFDARQDRIWLVRSLLLGLHYLVWQLLHCFCCCSSRMTECPGAAGDSILGHRSAKEAVCTLKSMRAKLVTYPAASCFESKPSSQNNFDALCCPAYNAVASSHAVLGIPALTVCPL